MRGGATVAIFLDENRAVGFEEEVSERDDGVVRRGRGGAGFAEQRADVFAATLGVTPSVEMILAAKEPPVRL